MTIVSALVGFVIFVATVSFGNKIDNRLLRYCAMIGGIFIGLGVAAALAPNAEAASNAGMIMFVLAVIYTVVFGKKGKV